MKKIVLKPHLKKFLLHPSFGRKAIIILFQVVYLYSYLHAEFQIIIGGMQFPAALTQPVTVICDLSPDIMEFGVFVPFLHTPLGGAGLNGNPVSSMLKN